MQFVHVLWLLYYSACRLTPHLFVTLLVMLFTRVDVALSWAWMHYRPTVVHILGYSLISLLAVMSIYRVGKKGATDSWPQFCQFLTDLRDVFTGRFCGKFAVTGISKILLHLAYVATLPCETLMSAKQAPFFGLPRIWFHTVVQISLAC